jgi:hypothetical protein
MLFKLGFKFSEIFEGKTTPRYTLNATRSHQTVDPLHKILRGFTALKSIETIVDHLCGKIHPVHKQYVALHLCDLTIWEALTTLTYT